MSEWKGDKIISDQDLVNDTIETEYPIMCESFEAITL